MSSIIDALLRVNPMKEVSHLRERGQLVVGKTGQATAQLMRTRNVVQLFDNGTVVNKKTVNRF